MLKTKLYFRTEADEQHPTEPHPPGTESVLFNCMLVSAGPTQNFKPAGVETKCVPVFHKLKPVWTQRDG